MDRWYKEPLLHFFILGTVLFALLYDKDKASISEKKEIVVSLKQLSKNWRDKQGSPPSKEELNSMISYYVEDEVLYREALRLGLDKDEPLIKKILVKKMKYIASDGVAQKNVTDKELRHYFDSHKVKFSIPIKRISFSHIYFNPTKDENFIEHADKLFLELEPKSYSAEDIVNVGNSFYGGNHFSNVTKKELSKYFSRTFIDEIFKLAQKKWSKPINSAFGRHIIYVSQVTEEEVKYEDVNRSVKDAWLIDANTNAYKRLYQALKKEYDIVIEPVKSKE